MATLQELSTSDLLAKRPDVAARGWNDNKVMKWWNKFGVKEMPNYTYSGKAAVTPTNPNVPTLNDLASQKYSFDPNQYLPQIQQTAASIYDPQRAQINALQQLQTSTTEQSRIRTNEDFDKQLQSDIEAINSRGSFFSGGALNQQAGVEKQRGYALQDINLQDQAAQAGFLAQQAGLSAAQAEYIQQKLTGAENSAYSRWQDNRNFLLSLTTEQRRQLEADRAFNEDVRQFGLNYALEKKKLKLMGGGSSGSSGNKTITYKYEGLPTTKDVNMNYNTGGGGSNGVSW